MVTARQVQRLAELHVQHPNHFMEKFFRDPNRWLLDGFRRVLRLGLATGSTQRVLDLGSGCGYFLLAAREHEHKATGLDIPDPVLEKAAKILRAPYVPHLIRVGVRLPVDLTGYDLVTMFGVNLKEPDRTTWWGWQEYSFLTHDVLSRIRSGGRWMIQRNRGPETAFLLRPETWRSILGSNRQVAIDGDQITIQKHD